MAYERGRTIVTADWVVPVTSPPIPGGAILIEGEHIVAVARASELTSLHPDAARVDLPGRVVTPGLVNAHTHLCLTFLEDLIPPAEFPDWLGRVPTAVRAVDTEGLEASVAEGARRCLSAGVTCVGDIAYGPESVAAATRAGLGGVFYWEVLGISAAALETAFAKSGFPSSADDPACAPRVRCGISPHAPYTSGPALLQEAYEVALTRFGAHFAVHVAESVAERELVSSGTGPLAGLSGRLAPDLVAQHTSPVGYLARLGVLDQALAIHAVHIDAADAAVLAKNARGVVVCPRSNEHLRNGVPALARLRSAGATIALGTDSLASNADLDLLVEARALRSLDKDLSPEELLAMITSDAARALGVDDLFGALKPGMAADIAAWTLDATDAPVRDLIEHGSSDTLDAVMTNGEWRIREGRPVELGMAWWAEYERARTAARAALGATGSRRV